jgi:uroporphyrinogen decarboxylase
MVRTAPRRHVGPRTDIRPEAEASALAERLTGRERFFASLGRTQPDRVPIFELFIHSRVIQGLVPGATYPDFAEIMGLDCVLTSTPSSLYQTWDAGRDGDTPLLQTEWGEIRARTVELVPIPIRHPVETRADWATYRVPEAHAGRFRQLDELVLRFKARKAVGVHLHDALSYPSYILGMSNLFVRLHDEPDWVCKVIDACVDHNAHMLKLAASRGAEFVVFGDDYGGKAGPLVSPAMFRQFFLPGIQRLVTLAKELGLRVIKHTDGNVTSIMEPLIETGIDGFHPSDPSAGMDIVEVKHRYANRLCVIGGIDAGDPLSHWPAPALVDEVRRRVDELAPGGGWIIASSNSLHASVRPENYAAMVWAARAFSQSEALGRYIPVPDLEARFSSLTSLATTAKQSLPRPVGAGR